ncbi:MAG: ABC transporter ATP-binding protein [Sneathiellaceae bacterium]
MAEGPGDGAEPPVLEMRDVGRCFASRDTGDAVQWVIRHLSFKVAAGEFVTIIGPSGAGKSTLLNLIAQTDLPSAGEILLRGTCIAAPGRRRLNPGVDRQIGYVTQDDNLLPWRSMLDNVLFPLEVQGRLDEEGRRRAATLVDAVGLTGFERHYPHELSGGMRKRCALIRTLVYDPPIILMDEPFGALDAQTRSQLQADLLRLWSMAGKTILFVTHDVAEAIALADRILILSRSPTAIAADCPVPIPRPRDLQNIYAVDGFAALHDTIRRQIQ